MASFVPSSISSSSSTFDLDGASSLKSCFCDFLGSVRAGMERFGRSEQVLLDIMI